MRNEIPRFLSKIVERPEHLSEYSKGVNTEKYNDLATTLKVMEATKSVVLDLKEWEALFGKCYKITLKAQLKKRGIAKPRIAIQNGSVHIWATKI